MMRNRNCETVLEDREKTASYSVSSRIHKVLSNGIYIHNICQVTDTSAYNNIMYVELSVNLSAFVKQIVFILLFVQKKQAK